MLPANANTGIVFIRRGIAGQPDRKIAANIRHVTATGFLQFLANAADTCLRPRNICSTALSGLGVDNAIIEMEGGSPYYQGWQRSGFCPSN